jgi:hypothetical protein
MAKKDQVIVVCADNQRRTCLQVERGTQVKYIPLDITSGLEVQTTSVESFDHRFRPMEGYPAEKACQLYLSYSQNIGASSEVLEYLSRVINVSKQEHKMATTKRDTAVSAKTEKAATAKANSKTAKPVEKAAPTKAGRRSIDPVVKPAAAEKTPPAKTGEKKPSAAQMFQDLIMEGKLTDDQIFEEVQEAFGLDEKKRGYVKWYRNHLKKQGANPPEPKPAK